MIQTFAARGIVLENESLLRFGKPIFGSFEGERGFREYPEPPRFRHSKRDGGMLRDFNEYAGYWLVSDDAKVVLEATDSEALAFKSCDFPSSDGSSGQIFWVCDVLHVKCTG